MRIRLQVLWSATFSSHVFPDSIKASPSKNLAGKTGSITGSITGIVTGGNTCSDFAPVTVRLPVGLQVNWRELHRLLGEKLFCPVEESNLRPRIPVDCSLKSGALDHLAAIHMLAALFFKYLKDSVPAVTSAATATITFTVILTYRHLPLLLQQQNSCAGKSTSLFLWKKILAFSGVVPSSSSSGFFS